MRNDPNPALFVSIKSHHRRLKAGGVEIMLKKMGDKTNVTHCYPHKFRRYTFLVRQKVRQKSINGDLLTVEKAVDDITKFVKAAVIGR